MTQFLTIENENKPKEPKITIFTHQYNNKQGWLPTYVQPDYYIKVIYLGYCHTDGDMFACYQHNNINICKGIKGDEFNNQ